MQTWLRNIIPTNRKSCELFPYGSPDANSKQGIQAVNIALLAVLLSFVSFDATAVTVQAQNVSTTLNRYKPAELARDGFATSRPIDQGHLKFGAQLHLDYSNDALVYESRVGDTGSQTQSVVAHQFAGHLVANFGLWNRLVLFAGLPVNFVMDGDTVVGQPLADGFGLGDAWTGARIRIAGEQDDWGAIALQGYVTLPTAQWADGNQTWSGDEDITGHPELVVELRPGGVVYLTGNAGVLLRNDATVGTGAGALNLGHALTYGGAVIVPLIKEPHEFNLYVEGYGQSDFDEFAKRRNSPFEVLGGLKFLSEQGLVAGLAAGPGLTRGYGTPDIRVVAMVGLADPKVKEKEAEAVPEPVVKDSDRDGLIDSEDRCPSEPEDKDDFEDQDGCPDTDNDKDGVLDPNDQCPMEAEDRDGFEDQDGCPEPDNDQDGLADAEDQCPDEPEDQDGFEDLNGCPDPDNDKDTVPDTEDECPLAPGKPEDKGCPKAVRMDQETGQIVILERVEFATGKARILPKSFPILEEVKATLEANPQVKRLRVEGHTDDRGRDSYNMNLSKSRSKSVKDWLIESGVDASRLESYGCGEARPIDSNKTSDGRQNNRRVEFHIVDPAPKQGARSTESCEIAE